MDSLNNYICRMNIHVEKELKDLETYFKDCLHKTCLRESQPVQMILRV